MAEGQGGGVSIGCMVGVGGGSGGVGVGVLQMVGGAVAIGGRCGRVRSMEVDGVFVVVVRHVQLS